MFGTTKQEQGAPKQGLAKSEVSAVAPAIDVYENDQEFLVFADLPGVKQDGAEITLEHERLSLDAKNGSRRYHREFIVPPSIDSEKVSATMKAGVLTVHLPKREPYKPRQIAVRSS
jgi:HSP20 family molecular chaperone IbpA